MRNYLSTRLGAALASMALAGQALAVATPIDVTSVTEQLTAGNAPIAAIGLGVLVLVAVIVVFKMVRKAA